MLRKVNPRTSRAGARLRGRRLAYPTEDYPPCPPTSGRRTRLDETLRREPPRTRRFSIELLPRAGLRRIRHARAVRGGDRARFRDQGSDWLRHLETRAVRRISRAARSDAGPGAESPLGEPVRDHHVREASVPLAGRAADARRRLPAGAHALGRRRPEGGCRRGRVSRTARPSRCAHRGRHLPGALRPLPLPASPRGGPAGDSADRERGAREPHEPDVPPLAPRSRSADVLHAGDPRLLGPGPRAGSARALGDGAAEPASLGARRIAPDARLRIAPRRFRRSLPAPRTGGDGLHQPGPFGWKAAPATPRPGSKAAGEAVPGAGGEEAFLRPAAHRGALGGEWRIRVHERGPDPQHGIQLVADVRGGDPREDRDRGTPLHRPIAGGDLARG